MKNMFRVLAPIAIIALAASCSREVQTDTVSGFSRKYSLSLDESTKTELSGTGSTRHVSWSEGDVIKYYTEPGQSSSVSATVNIDGSSAYVEIPRGRTDEFINAVYGATQLKSSNSTENCMYISSIVKSEQRYTTFSQAHICAAFSDDLENPNLQFHNAAAILKFTSSSSIHKVVFHGNADEIISGGDNGELKISYSNGAISSTAASNGGTSVTVSTNGVESDFYISILPVNFSSGITVNCYDSSSILIASKRTTDVINTTSSNGEPKIINLGNVQDWIAKSQPVAVDLGLSVKWASFNLGANNPEDCGDYYAWGETGPKDEYRWANYHFGNSKNGPFSKYVFDSAYGSVDHKSVLDLEDDAAHTNWGDDWRIPTKEEFDELKNDCNWTWTQKNGAYGYVVTSKKPGYTNNSIFLPANGLFGGSLISDVGCIGNYWSSSVSLDNTFHAISPYFSSSYTNIDNCYRYLGLAIRPVYGEVVPSESIDVIDYLNLYVGESKRLTISILPANATYKSVTWSSSDDSVAAVDSEGIVTAISIGQAFITVYSADAAKTATCIITVDDSVHINGTEIIEGNDLAGFISDKSTGKGIPGVIVTDGYDCVKTDENGVYQFKSNSLSRFVYYTTPAEYKVATPSSPSQPVFYKAIKPDGSLIRTDFTLDPLPGGKENNWTFVGIGDPQCCKSSEANRYASETIPDLKATTAGKSSVYAMTLGDIVFDSTDMWPTMKASMASVYNGTSYIVFFQTIGNHDHDSLKPDTNDDKVDDYNATSTFGSFFGPTDYSFDRGDVHVISMDNIPVTTKKSSSKSNGKTWNYGKGFSEAQFSWLKKDLELVADKENKMVFICCHIPFRAATTNHMLDVVKLMMNFKEAHLMIGHTHYTQNYVYSASYKAKGGLPVYEHIHGSACGAWWTTTSSSTVTGEPSGYTVYDIEGAHIKDWRFKGTNKDADFQLRVFDGNEVYYQSQSYPLNWYTASQKAGSGSFTVKGNASLRNCFVAQLFNDDDTYWAVDLRKKSTGEKIGSFKRLSNGSSTNVAMSAFYFNKKGKNSDSYASTTASHYWYYKPASGQPASETDWIVVATQTIPGSNITHEYSCDKLTTESDFDKEFYF